MKLYCVLSQHFLPMYQRFFEPSLRRVSPELEIVPDVFQVGGNADFRSAGFNQALIYKWKKGLEFLYANDGQVILFTDVDMVFNKPLVPAILDTMGDADIAVSPESKGDLKKWGVNVGVLSFRCTAQVRHFVSRVLDEMILRSQWDQFLFNSFLPQSKLRWKLLPFSFANGRVPRTPHSILYHATCTLPQPPKGSLEIKMEALLEAEAFFAGKGQASSPPSAT